MNLFEKLVALAFAPKTCIPCFHCKELIDPDHSDYWQSGITRYQCLCTTYNVGDSIIDPQPGFVRNEMQTQRTYIIIGWDDVVIKYAKHEHWVMHIWIACSTGERKNWQIVEAPVKDVSHFTSDELRAWAKRVAVFI